MSKLNDIQPNEGEDKTLNLRTKKSKKDQLPAPRKRLPKRPSAVTPVTDLQQEKPAHFIYIHGEKFQVPKYLGNLLKIAFFGFLILLIINSANIYFSGKKLEEQISAQTNEAYEMLIAGGKEASQIQFSNALSAFQSAKELFSNAENQLWFISTDNSIYAQDGNVAYAINAILEAGQHFAVAGEYFLSALEEFNKIPLYFVSRNNDQSSTAPSITDTLKRGLEQTDLAIKEISQAAAKIEKINTAKLPEEVRNRVLLAQAKISEIFHTLDAISTHFPALLKLLGDRYPHRILVLLQNNYELRPTGGFIGSYAIVDLNDGYIENLQVHDVYDLDGSFGGVVEPPDELKALTPNWRFRDSNYSPDFPTSARKARWFMELEGGPTVDTVIAINQGLLRDLLQITGPVQVGQFGQLNSENYNLLLSYVIEGKIWGPENPKHILKVFVPAFKEALFQEKNVSRVAAKLYRAVQQKHILVYSSDSDIQALLDYMGMTGRIHQSAPDEDYLAVINTSIGGTKSDQFIEQKINHHTKIDQNGNIINELEITRTHQWTDDLYRQWNGMLAPYGLSLNNIDPQIVDILGRGRNKVNMRIYVPEDSRLIATNDADLEIKYDKDLKKQYFFTRMELNAAESQTLKIRYQLPFQLALSEPAASYKLVVEKQPGTAGSIFNKSITADEDLDNLGFYPLEAKVDRNKISHATNLVYDRYFSSIWGR